MHSQEKKACIIGAGIAGACTARSLALRGWSVTVIDQAQVASGASGNPAAVIYPRLPPGIDAVDSFPHQAWLHAVNELDRLQENGSPWHRCGMLQLIAGNQAASAKKLAVAGWPAELVEYLDAAAASRRAGTPVHHDALCYPEAGWLEPVAYCHQLIESSGVVLREGTTATQFEQTPGGWKVYGENRQLLLESPVLIVANAAAATSFSQLAHLPLQPVRGQVSIAPASKLSAALSIIICHDGYLTPGLLNQQHCLGATFHPDNSDSSAQQQDQDANFELLHNVLPELATSLGVPSEWQARASIRCQSPDYLPLVGPVADYESFMQAYAGLKDGKVMAYPDLPALPGLYVHLAHGSKGFSQAGLAAEILAAELNGEPFPASARILDAIHPMRFWIKKLKRQK